MCCRRPVIPPKREVTFYGPAPIIGYCDLCHSKTEPARHRVLGYHGGKLVDDILLCRQCAENSVEAVYGRDMIPSLKLYPSRKEVSRD